MHKGSVLPFILLIITAVIIYFIYANYAKIPNQKTRDTAASIFKYPNSTWSQKDAKSVCILPTSQCSQPIKINFSSDDGWAPVYNYYKTYFIQRGWATNSQIVTSLPTSIVFQKNEDLCNVALESLNVDRFQFTISCPN